MAGELPLEEVYAAALDAEEASALPGRLARFLDAKAAALHWRDAAGVWTSLGFSDFPPEDMAIFLAEFADGDPWTSAALSPAWRGKVFLSEEAVSTDRFERSAFYNEFVRAVGDDTYWCVGGALAATPDGFGVLGVQRGKAAGAFSADDRDRLTALAPHLGRVMRLRARLSAAERRAEKRGAALSALGYAVFVVDQAGRVLDRNAAGERLAGQAGVLTVAARRLVSRDAADQTRLETALALATARNAPSAVALALGRGRTLRLDVVPLSGRLDGARALVLVQPLGPGPSVETRLRQMYGLTAAEARLAAELGQGAELADVADANGVAITTVRSQLRALAAKLEVSRQSQVAAAVASLPRLAD